MTTTVSGSQITFNDNTTQNTSAYGGGFAFRNRIINGGMVIDQRNAGASVTPSGATYIVDRWRIFVTQSSKLTSQQNAGSVTPPTGYTNYLGITSSSAYSIISSDLFLLQQFVEGFNVADLGWGTATAQTVTLSFWVRSSLTGTFGASLQNSAGDRAYPFTYTISSANTWEQKTVTIAGDTTGTWLTNNGKGIVLSFGLGVGSTASGSATGAWQAAGFYSVTGTTSVVGTNGATFYITGVQLEKGSTATSFDYRPYSAELAMCQRYYQLIVSGLDKPIAVGDYYTATQVEAVLQTKVTMRTAPTLSSTTGTNYYRAARNGGTDTFNSLTGDISFENALLVYNASEASGTAGHGTRLETSSSSAFLAFQAEL